MFVLVRHADAGKKGIWPGVDADRPLSPRGRQQAEGLAHNLSTMRQARLISSPYLRCQQTLQPLSVRPIRVIHIDQRLTPRSRNVNLDLDDAIFHGSIVCTHGETIAALLSRWQRHEPIALPIRSQDIREDATAKGGCWLFVDEADGWSAHYMPPLHAEAARPAVGP